MSHLNGAESVSESKENSNRVSIPPVEKITIDFSAVNVLRNHLLDAGSTAKVYEGRFGKERVAVKLCRLRTLNQKSVADFVREARRQHSVTQMSCDLLDVVLYHLIS